MPTHQRLIGALMGLALAACEAGDNGSLVRLEGLSFVPTADHSLAPRPTGLPDDWGLSQAILIGRFEVTRGEFLAHLDELGEEPQVPRRPWAAHSYQWEREDMALPAELTYQEATRYAESLGMRLPSAREWLHVAMGRTGQWYPWGGRDQDSVCNTREVGIGAPTLVGTFASGRSPLFDCYDLLGNLAEWTSSYVPGYMDSDFVIQWMSAPGDEEDWTPPRLVSVMGGSYSSQRLELYKWDVENRVRFNSRTVDIESVLPEVGMRLCADAEPYLWSHASSWGDTQAERQRVQRVGRRWASDRFAREQLIAILERLLVREGAPAPLGWLAEGVRETMIGG